MPPFVFLPTDAVMWLITAVLIASFIYVRRSPRTREKWSRVFSRPIPQASCVILLVFFVLGLADSIHFRPQLASAPGESPAYSASTVSLLDSTVGNWIAGRERSYSSPFAITEFDKTSALVDGKPVRIFAHLKGITPDAKTASDRNRDVALRALAALSIWVLVSAAAAALILSRTPAVPGEKRSARLRRAIRGCGGFAAAASGLILAALLLLFLWSAYHPFGTDKTGNDVLYQAVKSLRTAFVLGSLSTITMLPFAVFFGIAAGFFRGWVDDVVQYLYTTISSIPSVLLIAATALMIQVFIDQHPLLLPTSLERGDAKLFFIAAIIGVTGWASLARLLRAETMKLSGLDFITAARACGTPSGVIMRRHILPNVLHIILIVSVIGFSDIVLYEAVLSYIGVGVDPSMNSFGSMINAARNEMSRTPTVWWNLFAAFIFMVAVVLSANLFASAVRDAFDPRSYSGSGK